MVLLEQNLETGMIQYTSRDGTQIDALYSRPAGEGSYPAVIVTMEGMGLMDHHKDIAVRFAGQGYLAIAPDLYTREGTPEPENVMATLLGSPDSRAMDDLEGAALFLKSQAHSNGKVGIIGFLLRRTLHADDGLPEQQHQRSGGLGRRLHRPRADRTPPGAAHGHGPQPFLPVAGVVRG